MSCFFGLLLFFLRRRDGALATDLAYRAMFRRAAGAVPAIKATSVWVLPRRTPTSEDASLHGRGRPGAVNAQRRRRRRI